MSPAHRAPKQRPLLGAIWAQAGNGVIGHQGTMPWHVPEDLAHFKRVTLGHPVIMGRNTWQSFPQQFRPLPGRTNIVLTSQQEMYSELRAAGAEPAATLDEALALASRCAGSEEIWVIGGGDLYAQVIDKVDTAIITRLDLQPAGDTSAPQLPNNFTQALSDPAEGWHTSTTGTRYRFESWAKQRTTS